MKKALPLLILFLLLPCASLAEAMLTLEADALLAGEELHFFIKDADAVSYRYDVFLGQEQLVTGVECKETRAAYVPTSIGDYLLRATLTDAEGGTKVLEKSFQVAEKLTLEAGINRTETTTGVPVTVSLKVAGGAGKLKYAYSIWYDQTRIRQIMSEEATLQYTPTRAGRLTISATVTDARGNSLSAAVTAQVKPGAQMSVSGETGAFFAQGGIHTLTVHAPGIWTAETDSEFITLLNDAGQDGDSLFLSAPPTYLERGGKIRLTCGEETLNVSVTQSAESDEEEEIFLFSENTDMILADGAENAAWQNASGERTFYISASGEWDARTDDKWLALTKSEKTLLVKAEENGTETARTGKIILSCGQKQARVYVSQTPKTGGPDVLSAELLSASGIAYQDTVIARVQTTSDAQTLLAAGDQYDSPITFTRDKAAAADGGLLWTVELPLRGEGKQRLLLYAKSEEGTGKKQLAEVTVTGESAGFADAFAEALIDGDDATVTVRVTSATQSLSALNDEGSELRSFTEAAARVDRFIDEENQGRYAEWTLAMAAQNAPSYLRIGETQIPVEKKMAVEEKQDLLIYSQQSGYWADKKYRNSNLEHSGCAIFALAHALEVLGYEGESTAPEALAKKYAFCLVDGGTLNSTLIGNAGDDFGYKTRYKLYENKADIAAKLEQGAVFSFSVVSGHIALALSMSEDQEKILIIDSAPSATFERIKNAQMYIRDEQTGAFTPITALSELKDSWYYINTDAYGGAKYWLDTSYVVGRGARLIQKKAE